MKRLLLSFCINLILISCGQQSKITDAIPAERTADKYGDGRHTIMSMVLPLSDDSIESFDSPISKVGFILGGFTKIFADLGASMGMGKMGITLTQKIPEIPQEYISDISFKRIFFYIEPVRGERETGFWSRFMFGKDNVNFDFINRLAVRVKTDDVDPSSDWTPIVEMNSFKSKALFPLDQIFSGALTHPGIIDISRAKELVFLSYDKKKKDNYLNNNIYGPIYIVNTSTPAQTKDYLIHHPELDGVVERVHILNKSILIEIKKDIVLEEQFNLVLAEESQILDKLGVSFIEKCKPHTCFDFKVSDLNLMPILSKGTGIRIDAFIEAGKVPESFQLKGFIETEVKMNLTF